MKLCKGKQTYRSADHARAVRRSVSKKRTTRLRIYQCDSCFGWHLTKSQKIHELNQ